MNAKDTVETLKKASAAYYNSGQTIMSDEQYDNLVEQLRNADPENPYFQTVGAPPEGTMVKHLIPMGSQAKLTDKSDFERWAKGIEGVPGKALLVVQLKLDGSSVALNYEKGKLVSAVTRGNGLEGEDITQNVLRMQNVKKTLPNGDDGKSGGFTGSIRGEMLMRTKTFEDIVSKLDTSSGEAYQNARNAVGGIARDRKGKDLQKHISVIFYDVCTDSESFATEEDRVAFLKESLGVETVESHSYSSMEKAWEAFKKLEEFRDKLEFACDGVVVRANSIECQKRLGTSSDLRPKGQRCLKFAAPGGVTDLLDVENAVGHTGAVIPRAILKPIKLDGVTITHTTLSNFEEVARLGIAKGDKVRITRRGGVIPKLENKVEDGKNRVAIPIPTTCPSCGSPLVKKGAHLFCRNEDCSGQGLRRILTYVAKRNIKFLGEELVTELYERHDVKTPADLYSITQQQLALVTRGNGVVGSASVQVMAEIEKSRSCSLQDFMGSVCINFLGRRQAEILIGQGIDTVEKFLGLTVEQLCGMDGFKKSRIQEYDDDGEVIGESDAPVSTKATGIVNGIKKALPLIQELRKCVKITEKTPEPKPVAGGKLSGLTFCFTGAIEREENGKRFTRKMMWDVVKANGGAPSEEVDANCKYLVQADPDSTSSKTKKAAKLGVKVLSEADFWKMVEGR